MIRYTAVMGAFLACLSLPRVSPAGASDGPQTQPAPDKKAIRSVADLDGNWSGEKEGVKVRLLLPAYQGNDKAIKQSALNGKKPVGEIMQTSDGTLRLRVIPTGYNHPETADNDLPAVEGVLLNRTASTVD
jgi:hypothetical protein